MCFLARQCELAYRIYRGSPWTARRARIDKLPHAVALTAVVHLGSALRLSSEGQSGTDIRKWLTVAVRPLA